MTSQISAGRPPVSRMARRARPLASSRSSAEESSPADRWRPKAGCNPVRVDAPRTRSASRLASATGSPSRSPEIRRALASAYPQRARAARRWGSRIEPGLGFTEDELNGRVRRLHPAKDGRSPITNPVYAERTGRLTAPLLTLHETGDAWGPLSLEQAYRRRTLGAGTAHLLVQRVVRAPSHCGFDGETREQAFDDLVARIERGVRPDVEDVLAPDLSRIGLR